MRYIVVVFHHFNDGLEDEYGIFLCFSFFSDNLFIRLLGYLFIEVLFISMTILIFSYSFIGDFVYVEVNCNIWLFICGILIILTTINIYFLKNYSSSFILCYINFNFSPINCTRRLYKFTIEEQLEGDL